MLTRSLSKVRGQCYDGASSMSGIRSGVAKRIMGHSLNLAVSDSIKQSKLMQDALTPLER